MSQKITLRVTGKQKMNCSGCERSAELILATLAGVHIAQADHKTQRVAVTYEPERVSTAAIQAALEEIGYATTPLST